MAAFTCRLWDAHIDYLHAPLRCACALRRRGMADPILARVSSVPAIGKSARQAKLLWKRLFFWPLNALRKPRLRKFGLELHSTLSIAQLRLGADCGCSPSDHFVPLSWDAIKGFARAGKGEPVARALAPTATIVSLDQFASFDAWRLQVSKITQGKYHRSANKARRLGYSSRFVRHHAMTAGAARSVRERRALSRSWFDGGRRRRPARLEALSRLPADAARHAGPALESPEATAQNLAR
jgi:hypothetical protein